MGFSSYEFILLFLPIVFIVYYWLKKRDLNRISFYWILLASFFFYACDEPVCLLVLFFHILVNFLFYKAMGKNKSKWLLAAGIIFNIVLLGYFKYINLGIGVCNMLLHTSIEAKSVILPLGISFITFQQVAFLVDRYKNTGEEECNFFDFALFVSFFPHISLGPIILKEDFFPLLKKMKGINWDRLGSGIYFFFCGLGKKVLIADVLARGVDHTYANLSSMNTTTAIFASVLFTLQIYYDFSGYSDMAIGVARMLQLDLPINFNSPYKAITITEFWERWHMTLTHFLTRYLYIPLGGNRKGKIKTYVNTLIVFTISGLWHGAAYTFVLWGLLHGMFMIFTKQCSSLIRKIPNFINHIVTLVFINATWILFRAGSFHTLREYMGTILKGQMGAIDESVVNSILPSYIEKLVPDSVEKSFVVIFLIVLIILVTLFAKNTQEQMENRGFTAAKLVGCVFVGVLSLISMSGVSTFIYAYF